MKEQFTLGFWFWGTKFEAIIAMLDALAGYEFDKEQCGFIKQNMRHTNDEKNHWFEYIIEGKLASIGLALAYDGDDSDIIHVRIQAPEKLKDKISALETFQNLFKNLDLEK